MTRVVALALVALVATGPIRAAVRPGQPEPASSSPSVPEAAPCGSISFARAMALAAGQSPRIAFAREQVEEAFARLEGARVLMLPLIQAGATYVRHEGPLQNGDGSISPSDRSSLEVGPGLNAVGGGAPSIAGVAAKFAVTDAVFQPRIAREALAAQQRAATAVTHDVLLSTALAYLGLLTALERQAIARETLDHAGRLAELTGAFAGAGQGNEADADRAQTELVVRRNAVSQTGAQAVVAAGGLAEVLHLAPGSPLVPVERTLVPITLVPHDRTTRELVADGLLRRPELAESRHLIRAAVQRLDREKSASLLPIVVFDASESAFGGGVQSTVGDVSGRFDVDVTVYWQLRNLGAGDASARRAARAQVNQARQAQARLVDQVSREIVEAQALADSLRAQIDLAASGIRVAESSYRRNVDRIRAGVGLPLEVLQSIQALDQSRQEYLRTVSSYDEWEFRLFRAMGSPIPEDARPGTEAPPTGHE